MAPKFFAIASSSSHLTDGDTGEAFGVDRLDHAASIDVLRKSLKELSRKYFGQLDQLHPKTTIRLVAAESIDRLVITQGAGRASGLRFRARP